MVSEMVDAKRQQFLDAAPFHCLLTLGLRLPLHDCGRGAR